MALPTDDELKQAELRRRLRAARVICDLKIDELARRIDPDSALGERTLRKLESGETKLRPPILRELAVAMGIPYFYFECEDVWEQFRPNEPDEWTRRLRDVEARLEDIARGRANGDGDGDAQPTTPGSLPEPSRRGPRGTRQARQR